MQRSQVTPSLIESLDFLFLFIKGHPSQQAYVYKRLLKVNCNVTLKPNDSHQIPTMHSYDQVLRKPASTWSCVRHGRQNPRPWRTCRRNLKDTPLLAGGAQVAKDVGAQFSAWWTSGDHLMMEIGGYIIYPQDLLVDLQLTSTKCFQLKGFRFLHNNDLLQL